MDERGRNKTLTLSFSRSALLQMLEEASCSSSDEGSEEDEIGKGGSKGVGVRGWERERRRVGGGGKRKDKEEIGEVVREER